MIIGVDFDNTLVCYDGLFHQQALAHGWIDAATPASKTAVRDAMREEGMEHQWIKLQGRVYGQAIAAAPAFPGVHAFFEACANHDITLHIISHKTQHPASGEPFDLIEAAKRWLDSQKLMHHASGSFFEPTKRAKLDRIAALGCEHFIDDLPEFLADLAEASPACTRWLFDPTGSHGGGGDHVLAGWDDAFEKLSSAQSALLVKGSRDA